MLVSSINILVADDHALVRDGIKQVISTEPMFKVTHEADTGDEVLKILQKNKIDILLMDIDMPGRDGLEILKIINLEYPHIKVLMISMYSEEQYAIRAFKAGASGYLSKSTATYDLIKALMIISQGRKYISPNVAEILADTVSDPGRISQIKDLSDRELQVLKLIASGKTQTDIAHELFLSVKTISTYRTRILEKLGLSNTSELIRYAIENKIN